MRGRFLCVALLALLAGCAHVPPPKPAPAAPPKDTKVSYDVIPADTAGQYSLSPAQTSYGAQPVVNDPPAYPPALVTQNLGPQVIRAKVIVDGEGKVTDVRDLDTSADAAHAAFFAASRDAAMHWSYSPMTIVEEHEDTKGKFSETHKTAPFSMDYAFRFELKDGVPTVSSTH